MSINSTAINANKSPKFAKGENVIYNHKTEGLIPAKVVNYDKLSNSYLIKTKLKDGTISERDTVESRLRKRNATAPTPTGNNVSIGSKVALNRRNSGAESRLNESSASRNPRVSNRRNTAYNRNRINRTRRTEASFANALAAIFEDSQNVETTTHSINVRHFKKKFFIEGDVEGDGACLFHAVGHTLKKRNVIPHTMKLTCEAQSVLRSTRRKDKSKRQPLLSSLSPALRRLAVEEVTNRLWNAPNMLDVYSMSRLNMTKNEYRTKNQYQAAMIKRATYGTLLEVQALSIRLKTPIFVFLEEKAYQGGNVGFVTERHALTAFFPNKSPNTHKIDPKTAIGSSIYLSLTVHPHAHEGGNHFTPLFPVLD